MQSSKLGTWKGYHLSTEVIRKGYLFCWKWYLKGVRGWTLKLSIPLKNCCIPLPQVSYNTNQEKLFPSSWASLFLAANAFRVTWPFVSDTSPKCTDREGLGRRCTGGQGREALNIFVFLTLTGGFLNNVPGSLMDHNKAAIKFTKNCKKGGRCPPLFSPFLRGIS